MKKILSIVAVMSVVALFTACSSKVNVVETSETKVEETKEQEVVETTTERVEETTIEETVAETALQESNEQKSEGEKIVDSNKVEISVKDFGVIQLELDPEAAPITVANFKKLVNEGFYNGLTFHRIISGFMIQGGDPKGDGTGGSPETIKGEFASNGVNNPLKHDRGVISMARTMIPDSASSQFFIMHKDSPHLDGDYAAFGKVTSGIEIVDAICAKTKVQDGNGTVAKADQPVIEYIKLIE